MGNVYVTKMKLNDIVTHMTIARQRLGKHIPGVTLSKIEGQSRILNNRRSVFHGVRVEEL
jgi:hypothetical protein